MKPPGYEQQLEKYIKKDGAFLGDFRQQKRPTKKMILNMKLINFCGDMTLKVKEFLLICDSNKEKVKKSQ